MTLPENDIAHQLKNGNEAVFEKIFRDYYGKLCGYAVKYVAEKDQAEEIVQELFYTIWSKRSALVITISVEAYLFRAVRNACLNYLKHLKVRAQHENSIRDSSYPLTDSVHETLELLELQQKIDEAIELMPNERRKIFKLSRIEGLKYKEIADQLNISIKTVEAQMGKALEFLRENLMQYLIVTLLIIVQIILFLINHE